MNEEITYKVLQACVDSGVTEFVVCAGSRNSSFVEALRVEERVNTYYWPEERSAAFFALGRSRATKRPVAIVTTSGTAAAELLPAAVEAYYSGVPLILITADRPRYFRGSGAPQSAEQDKMFGYYTKIALDVSLEEPCDLSAWDRHGPMQINVCLDEPQKQPKFQGRPLTIGKTIPSQSNIDIAGSHERLDRFLNEVNYPLAIVSTLKSEDKEAVAQLLIKLGIPAMIEGISGLREDPRLQSISIMRTDKVLEDAKENGYPVDGVLRIGGIPTHRIWRDLEYLQDKMKVCGLSEQPFSGLSWSRLVIQGSIGKNLTGYNPKKRQFVSKGWLAKQKEYQDKLQELFQEEPMAEPALFSALADIIPSGSQIYLGNSLPIREWDMAAGRKNKHWEVNASRGCNGIDGQISTFLGLCRQQGENWGIFGDLTTLYDLAGCWILPKLECETINIVVINNGGGKIFDRMYPYKEMQNLHQLSFKPFAEMWGLEYDRWNIVPEIQNKPARRLIEIIPDDEATQRFWKKHAKIGQPDAIHVSR